MHLQDLLQPFRKRICETFLNSCVWKETRGNKYHGEISIRIYENIDYVGSNGKKC